jgi:hypothetical protein
LLKLGHRSRETGPQQGRRSAALRFVEMPFKRDGHRVNLASGFRYACDCRSLSTVSF